MTSILQSAVRRLRIQYASDLHLEFHDNFVGPALLKPVAPVLALAGDIGNPYRREYRDFLAYCSHNWDAVFVVAGNHEFYNKRDIKPIRNPRTVSQTVAAIRDTVSEFSNVHFLDRARVDRCGVAFLGCTLWTDTSINPPLAAAAMTDYRRITEDGVCPITPAVTTAWHRRDRAWLADAIATCADKGVPAVVLTHHLPSYAFVASRYASSPINFCFASRCDDLLRPPVRAWIAGHTHSAVHRHWTFGEGAVSETLHGCVNSGGYPSEAGTGYCREIFVDIPTAAVNDILFERGGDPLVAAAAATDECEEFDFK
jgi:hypothetical protein